MKAGSRILSSAELRALLATPYPGAVTRPGARFDKAAIPPGYVPPPETAEARAFRLDTEGGPGGLAGKLWCNACQRFHAPQSPPCRQGRAG